VRIEPGRTIFHYRILAKLGEGGMGIVWRAVDTTLDREVAIKVLPEALAADPERLARFDREAKLLASLKHPNIAEIHGLHAVEEDQTRFIVMELVEGEDLAQRLGRAGPLPRQEVLDVARQVAGALEAAHEQGVVHRDLKPANVKLTPDGHVKVLDFGLAKAFQPDPASGEASPSMSPTLTSMGTRAGVILGTAAYMAPEQARGHAVDKRADIWALGCLLYELLTGRPTFAGDTISDTLAAVLKTEPDWEALPDDTDPALRLLIARCLEKDVRQRMRDVGEVRIAVERIASSGDSASSVMGAMFPGAASMAGGAEAAAAAPSSRRPVLVALLALVAVVSGIAGWWLRPSTGSAEHARDVVRRFEIVTPGIGLSFSRAPTLSPDGRRMAYVADGKIWIRDLDQLEPREVPESDDAQNLMWSPDGEQIGWQANGKIWRAGVGGGARTAICDVPSEIEATAWGPDDRILLTPDVGPIYEVSARGGDPRPLLEPVEGQDEDFHVPSFLPGGRGLIFTAHRIDHDIPDTIEVLVDGERKVVLQIEDHWLFQAQVTESGYLVYRRGTSNEGLWAAPFSLEEFELTGEPVLLDPAGIFHSVSRDGSLLYYRGSGSDDRRLVWVDREGRVGDAIGQPQTDMSWPSLSPDGLRVAVAAPTGESQDIWVHDTVRGTRTRLTFGADDDWSPAWYPDGTRVVLGRRWAPRTQLVAVAADGSGGELELTRGELADVTPDGKNVVFERRSDETEDDLLYVPTGEGADAGTEPTLLLGTPQGEEHVQLSPDGKYVAYTSADSGRDEIYLKRFPSGEGRWQVSVDGGDWSRFSPTGGELFFLSDRGLMAVDVELGATPRIGTPRVLFSLEDSGLIWWSSRPYDVAPDGNRFVMLQGAQQGTGEPTLTLVENWIAELE
jgi:Tol biopolymer transport system component